MNEKMIPYDQLKHGMYYRGECRNASVARWNNETKQFIYMRTKFMDVFPEEIGYWLDTKAEEFRFDEFKPYEELQNVPYEIPLTINYEEIIKTTKRHLKN